jgi:pimeloyl-ACP methyl ester carboxylesterase
VVPFSRHGAVLARRIPGAELLAVDGGGHVAIFTHRALVKARVDAFLRARAPIGSQGGTGQL